MHKNVLQCIGSYHEVGDDVPIYSRYKLKEYSASQVWYERDIKFVLLPCGHTSTGEEYATNRCPQCGKAVETKYCMFL